MHTFASSSCNWTSLWSDFPLQSCPNRKMCVMCEQNLAHIQTSGTKPGHKHKESRQNPPPPPEPPPRDPSPCKFFMFCSSFPFKIQEKGFMFGRTSRGILGAPKFFMLNFFACFFCAHTDFHAQSDWMTGVPDNGNDWRKFRALPRSYPLCSLTSFNGGGSRGTFGLPGVGGGSFPLYGGTFARSYSVSKIDIFWHPALWSKSHLQARLEAHMFLSVSSLPLAKAFDILCVLRQLLKNLAFFQQCVYQGHCKDK